MKLLTHLAIIMLIIAFFMTGLGGWMDMSYNKWQFTKEHLWNDGLFLGIVAIAIIVWNK